MRTGCDDDFAKDTLKLLQNAFYDEMMKPVKMIETKFVIRGF